ncbi:MAG: hypothetical protein JXB49_19485 [Bacteroidales bacterium]|nr:hypothetical protein [Bacteroidales bacterium]
MVKRNFITSLVIISLVIINFSCEKDEKTTDKNDLKISGYIYNNDAKAIENAKVSIDNIKFATTDANGYFEVSGLNSGTHVLSAKYLLSDSSYSELTDSIILNENNYIYESLILPLPVVLHEPLEIQPDEITLMWSKSLEDNFREYRLYIGGSYHQNILSSENGTLVNISTDVNDTIFTINNDNYSNAGGTISPNGTYPFRLYVYNGYDKISGSNILTVNTPNWDTTDFTANYSLELITNFAGAEPIKGIDWDDKGNLWIFYYHDYGYINGTYQGEGKVVNYNYVEDIYLDTIEISDFNECPSGIAFDDTRIWVQMKSFQGQLVAFDIATGQQLKSMMLSSYTSYLSDISKMQNGFIIIWNFHNYEILNNNGGILTSGKTPFSIFNEMRVSLGVAVRNNEYWISSSNTNEIAIMNQDGQHIGIVKTGINIGLMYGADYKIAIRNNKLAIATNSHIYIFNIAGL